MKKSILKWELVGIVFIVVIGGALHFAFELSGGWRPLALIAAVNESVWEHLKLGFWPALIYFLIEYRYLIKYSGNLLFAKAIGLLLIPVAITVLFYAYTAIIEDMLAIDLTIFVVAVVAGAVKQLQATNSKPLAIVVEQDRDITSDSFNHCLLHTYLFCSSITNLQGSC